MSKTAFITGITSQDASFLAEQLLEKGYKVYGLKRRSSVDTTWRLRSITKDIEFVTGDMTDQSSLNKAIKKVNPDEVYNLAAQSFVGASWDCPEYTIDVNALGAIRLFEAIRMYGKNTIRIYQASSSEQFGKVRQSPQTETTPFYPRSIYGVSKVAAHWAAVNYRESYNMFISCGICFNHESHRRGLEFLSRKVAYGVAKIKCGLSDTIALGNMDAERDFGFASEYTDAMWRILQLDEPGDYVVSTEEKHSVKEFVREAFKAAGIDNWGDYITVDPRFMRPAEVDYLLGDCTKFRNATGWKATTSFPELVKIMVNSDIERLLRGDRFE